MSDPRREQALERLIESEFKRQASKVLVESTPGGGIRLLFGRGPVLFESSLPREEAIAFSQDLIRAIAAGEPTWEGFD
jgi:hypothetical protein